MWTRRPGRATATALVLAVGTLISGCGVGPSGVEDGGEAPTGLAEGPTLYFVDAGGRLRPDTRDTGRLGTVQGAVQLLMADANPTAPGLRNEVPPTRTRTVVEDAGDYVTIYLPLRSAEISAAGVDQIICTAAAVVATSGRAVADVAISVRPTHGAAVTRPCPVVS
ncbi:GerMN domain-containing protein [Promicromonospora panici]|uniref:GerMN domain-containing protein n=1 Tax=Promicromonospora panici TaxID=2219658 RepID=UPI00101D2D94|nr:GerMN domain-containing protein [Promicromonospora panici]